MKIILLICVVGCIGFSQMVWYQESKSFEERFRGGQIFIVDERCQCERFDG
ncbi:MAG: hypothetical protein NUV74_16445 [Candidatus Brocadiaceae bacterium]|nr:hypothetical protein [Candidatus Brocadiaceae bacterium]